MSVQVRGSAEIVRSSDPQFAELVAKYKPVRLTPLRARLRFNLVRITPASIIYFDTNLPKEKAGIYQKWERKN